MPIIRTPVAHKFGIISQTQKVELEKRIATKAYNETRRKLEAQNISELRPLPFEVTEEFVYKFNDCSPSEREKMQDTSMKMLERLKRLAGLRQTSDGNHVDLARAWVDLALLSQCRFLKLEEACFMTLIASLDQAVASEKEILSLFYLAKSGIHWLKKETGNESVLRSNEILLIKMTYLVFLRLYCHHILQELKNYEDQKASLSKYLAGFHEKEKAFHQFPGANLSIQIITEAGRRICSDIDGVEDSRRQKTVKIKLKVKRYPTF
ncbi:transmembrane protein 232-like isoform X3 [Xenia sp. Carnegie-2017]|uniref:transmembrane protein 232-like isoform X3 n=1 Tax=Xenia sp. Carnegie-2017 TaxID=2897299 RepID=UPI001F0383B1|nr:transmembrane protein 232-like isoform X3 [Xenia sp. Carnegie-2017]